jgi:secretion/DNA translocation related TadE-like protein
VQSRRSNRLRDDTGSATLIAVAMMAVLVAFTVGGFYLASAVVSRHRGQSAADLSALAAAASLVRGVDAACSRAAAIASAMNGALAECTVDGLDVVITIQVGKARAAARAGPV